MNIGSNIKFFREMNNMTRQELSEKINVTTVTISRYENDKREPGIEALLKIANAFNITLDELVNTDVNDYKVDFSEPNSEFTLEDDPNYDDIDKVELRRADYTYSYAKFFYSLGITLIHEYDYDNHNNIFVVNGVKYDDYQFSALLESIKSYIITVNNITKEFQ